VQTAADSKDTGAVGFSGYLFKTGPKAKSCECSVYFALNVLFLFSVLWTFFLILIMNDYSFYVCSI